MRDFFSTIYENGFLTWRKPLYLIVGILSLVSGLIFLILGLYLYISDEYLTKEAPPLADIPSESLFPQTLTTSVASASSVVVYVSGAVKHPGLYELPSDSRVFHAMEKAGGLSSSADSDYIQKELNLADKVKDNQKIYFQPYQKETDTATSDLVNKDPSSRLISINSASAETLETLPGIGEKLAEKIISNRPYETIEELRTKAQIGESIFGKIKELVKI